MTISIGLPVIFERAIQSMVVIEGDSGTFSCELSKPGAPVQWRKGKIILKSGEKYDMKQEGRVTQLLINNVEESDGGKYTCKTKDSLSTAELIVQGEKVSSTSVHFSMIYQFINPVLLKSV